MGGHVSSCDISPSDSFKIWLVPRAVFFEPFENEKIPSHQELRSEGKLHAQNISASDLLLGQLTQILVISHRWLSAHHPDTHQDSAGEQLHAIRTFLQENTTIEYVWIDYCSMPQKLKDQDGIVVLPLEEEDQLYFKQALQLVNLLYLFLPVLVMLDADYGSRFWCNYESFLATHSFDGKQLVTSGTAHISIACLGSYARNTPKVQQKQKELLVDSWTDATVDEAFDILGGQDIKVTNQSDKDEQLLRLRALETLLQEVFSHIPVEVQQRSPARVPSGTQASPETADVMSDTRSNSSRFEGRGSVLGQTIVNFSKKVLANHLEERRRSSRGSFGGKGGGKCWGKR